MDLGIKVIGSDWQRVSGRTLIWPLLCAIRRTFMICNASQKGGRLTLPAVPPAVSYRSVRSWQRGGAKPAGQRNLDSTESVVNARADTTTASITSRSGARRPGQVKTN